MAELKLLLPEITNVANDESLTWSSFQPNPENMQLQEENQEYDVSFFPTPWARLQMTQYIFYKLNQEENVRVMSKEELKIANWVFDLLEIIYFKNYYNIELEFNDLPEMPIENSFEKAKNLFWQYGNPILIKQKLNDNEYKIIGSTSPYTLVFPAFHRIDITYPMGLNRILFDPEADSIDLVNRPDEFKEYLIFLSRNINLPSAKEFKNYLARVFRQKISAPNFQARIEPLVYFSSEGGAVRNISQQGRINTLYQFEFFCLKSEFIKFSSDYQIHSIINNEVSPILLDNKIGDRLDIIKGFTIKIPLDSETLKNSKKDVIPGTILKCIWRSVDDFIQNCLIKLPYDLDLDDFYSGRMENIKGIVTEKFLLPLTEEYFRYFGFNDDRTHSVNNNYVITESYGVFNASLRIPLVPESTIKDKLFTLEQKFDRKEAIIDLCSSSDNYDKNWYLTIFPNFRLTQHANELGKINYFVQICDDIGAGHYPMNTIPKFYKENFDEISLITISAEQVRLKKKYSNFGCLTNYKLDTAPQLIRLDFEFGFPITKYYAFIIPKYKLGDYQFSNVEINQENGCVVAIDFGTSNTAIAIKKTHKDPELINFKHVDSISTISDAISVANKFKKDFLQNTQKYFFNNEDLILHIRSLISKSKLNLNLIEFISSNIYVDREELEVDRAQNEILSEFKWKINAPSATSQPKDWVKNYIINLLYLLKYDLLASGELIDFKVLKFNWFYPLAFGQTQLTSIKSIWQVAVKEVFPLAECNINGYDESIPPFFDSSDAGGEVAKMNIDIGGGTTDICIMKGMGNSSIQILKLSLPFASRDIVGDLYNEYKPDKKNGIVDKKYSQFAEILGSHEAFIQAITKRSDVEPIHVIRELIQDYDILILFFYYCIINYVKLTIDNNYASDKTIHDYYPLNISFSGNGSNIIKAILTSEKQTLEEDLDNSEHSFCKLTSTILGTNESIRISFNQNPKSSTVMGSFKMPGRIISETKSFEILGENLGTHTFNQKINEVTISSQNIPRITDSYILTTLLPEFIQFLKNQNNRNDFLNKMYTQNKIDNMIDKIEEIVSPARRGTYLNKIGSYIQGGLNSSGKGDEKINSSFMFYGLKGILNELSRVDYTRI